MQLIAVFDFVAASAKAAISIRRLWARCRRSAPVRPTPAFIRRMSAPPANLLKTEKNLRLANDSFQNTVQTRSTASPQGGSEPEAEVVFHYFSQLQQGECQNFQPLRSDKSGRSCRTQRVLRHLLPLCGRSGHALPGQ